MIRKNTGWSITFKWKYGISDKCEVL
jgi:hypothetical protein